MKKWSSVSEVHERAEEAVGKPIKSIVSEENVKLYYSNPKNKGWTGNAIEKDWFQIPNNNRKEADIPYLNLEIKVTPVEENSKGWSAKERLTLNVFNYSDEYKRDFKNASFFEKAELTELLFYKFLKGVPYPEMEIVKAHTFDMAKDISEEDMEIIKSDWEIIIDKIKKGKAHELTDKLTKYLGATTKGGKSEKNMTSQPCSKIKAHRRAFTLKTAYMTQLVRCLMGEEQPEKLFKDTTQLKKKSFEEIVIEKFSSYIGQTKESIANKFNVEVPKENDKASSSILAKKMLNLEGDIQDTEEFKKAGISVKIVTFDSSQKQSYPHLTEGLKIQLPNGNYNVNPFEIIKTSWVNSELYNYLSSYQFLLVVFEKTKDSTIFRGVKFWSVPNEDFKEIERIWLQTKRVLQKGVTLEYEKRNKGKGYQIRNNLPSESGKGTIFHIRPSSKEACYKANEAFAMRLPHRSNWINLPTSENEFSSYFMTKQAWWFSSGYMYEQVKDLLK